MSADDRKGGVFELPGDGTHGSGRADTNIPTTDVCLIVEGCYPYVSGGVSSWLDWLMRQQPDINFSVIAIVSGAEQILRPRYEPPENLRHFSVVKLKAPQSAQSRLRKRQHTDPTTRDVAQLSAALTSLIRHGGFEDLATITRIVNGSHSGGAHGSLTLDQLMHSRLNWQLVCETYEAVMPHASFHHFYWAWRALFGGMFAVLKAPLPPAKVYHTISTGYAGLLAARAAIETGRPAVVTEHGIYTNERRIEILMAEWIADKVHKGMGLEDDRIDLRDVWTRVFDAYARACYDGCEVVTTLYRENQRLQCSLGANPDKLIVIANGIKVENFEHLPVAAPDQRPTMGLIGRVVPIKDVKTFIAAAGIARERLPTLHALVMGPYDEDAAYYDECAALVAELGLEDCVTFTGSIKVTEYLPRLHTVVLTSLSEAQPLVLLEAGAAGIPCIATDVGSCREIIFGRDDEAPALGPGGAVTGLVAPDQIAEAVCTLLLNPDLRRQQGEALRQRVRTYYASWQASEHYGALYGRLIEMPTHALEGEAA